MYVLCDFVLSNNVPNEVRTELDKSQGNIKWVVAAVGFLFFVLFFPPLCHSDGLHLTVDRKLKLGQGNRLDIQSARSWGDKEREKQRELMTGRGKEIYYGAEIHPRSLFGSIHNRKCDFHQGGGLFNDLPPYPLQPGNKRKKIKCITNMTQCNSVLFILFVATSGYITEVFWQCAKC